MTQYTKKAFITGAAKGLGRATAVALSTSGYKTILTDVDPVELAETQKNYRRCRWECCKLSPRCIR